MFIWNQARNLGAGTKADKSGWMPLTILILQACSYAILIHPRTIFPGVAPPTVGWAFQHQLVIKIASVDTSAVQSDGNNPSIDIVSFQVCLGLCQADNKALLYGLKMKYHQRFMPYMFDLLPGGTLLGSISIGSFNRSAPVERTWWLCYVLKRYTMTLDHSLSSISSFHLPVSSSLCFSLLSFWSPEGGWDICSTKPFNNDTSLQPRNNGISQQ